MLLQYWFNSATCLWNSLSFSKFCFLYVGFSHFFIFFVAIVNWVFLPPLWFLSGYCYSIRKLLATWILVWQFFGCVSSSWQKSNCLISTSLKCQLLRKRKYSFFFFFVSLHRQNLYKDEEEGDWPNNANASSGSLWALTLFIYWLHFWLPQSIWSSQARAFAKLLLFFGGRGLFPY